MTILPTIRSGTWSVESLKPSLARELRASGVGSTLDLFFYAVTLSGWNQIAKELANWRQRSKGQVTLFVGTDHAITDPEALRVAMRANVKVLVLTDYVGVFHPKVISLRDKRDWSLWVGSNNLTRDGFRSNIEMAILAKSKGTNLAFDEWAREVELSAVECDENLVLEYQRQRERYQAKMADAGQFVWQRRVNKKAATQPGKTPRREPKLSKMGDLALQIMPRETGGDGKQIQFPMSSLEFFGLTTVPGDSRTVRIAEGDDAPFTTHPIRVYPNKTARIVIAELDYQDRPCVLLFRKAGKDRFVFEILSRNTRPVEHDAVLRQLNQPTRQGSRRWGILGDTN